MKIKKLIFHLFLTLLAVTNLLAQNNLFNIAKTAKTRSFMTANKKFGIIDEDLNVIIPAKYNNAGEWTGKYANVKIEENIWALIDKDCNEIIRFTCKRLEPYINNWCLKEELDGKFSLVNENNDYLVMNAVHATGFSEGLASVTTDYNHGLQYIDSKGNVIIKLDEEIGQKFKDGIAIISNRFGKMGAIDRNGKEILPVDYNLLYYVGEGYFICKNPENNIFYKIINSKGQTICTEEIRHTSNVYNGKIYINVPGIMVHKTKCYNINERKLYPKTYEIDNIAERYLATIGKGSDGKFYYTMCDSNFNALCNESFYFFCDEYNDIFSFHLSEKNLNEVVYINKKGKTFYPNGKQNEKK